MTNNGFYSLPIGKIHIRDVLTNNRDQERMTPATA